MEKSPVGVLGGGSFIAGYLRPLLQERHECVAFSRMDGLRADATPRPIARWVSLMPIAALPDRLPMIEAHDPRRIVVVSSTSIFTKTTSPDRAEIDFAARIAEAEQRLIAWAEARGVAWTILRPTLVYGGGRDRNVSEIARFIRRFGFFPVLGAASGLRQPVHAQDVAAACAATLENPSCINKAYNISGGETVSYRDMVERIFAAAGRPAKIVNIPAWSFIAAVACAKLLPRFRGWSTAMPRRMNQNMIFDHSEAARDFGFAPRAFRLDPADLPGMHNARVARGKGEAGQRSGLQKP